MKMIKSMTVGLAMLCCSPLLRARESVDVTFRYTNASVSSVTVPGEFDGWNTSANPMANQGSGLWTRTIRLRLGGNPAAGGIPGAWQYKFYTGVTPWPHDVLDHHVNSGTNDNSFIYTKDPTFYQVLPNQDQPVVTTATPTITAYIFPKVGAAVDPAAIQVTIDGSVFTGIGSSYDGTSKKFAWTVPDPISNGSHTLIISAGSTGGGTNADTVTFFTSGGYVQITNEGGYSTLSAQRTLYGVVLDTTVTTATVFRNGTDSTVVAVSKGGFSFPVSLNEGVNTFIARADSAGRTVSSSPVTFTRVVNHAPNALITLVDNGGSIGLQATGSADPDTAQTSQLTFLWSEDATNPSVLGGINGSTSPTLSVARPTVPGEYYFGLIATDPDGNKDTTRNFFTLTDSLTVVPATLATVPSWVRQGRMYLLFFKMHTAAGTINAALPDLDRIAAMGYNIIWIMPVMKNNNTINNGPGPGYEIVDFLSVAPEYGTTQDFKNFVSRAHQLGMKVILDVTPNHTSHAHPFVLDARAFRESSRYWTYYQHQMISYTGVGLGQLDQAITDDGFVYYGAFSDALLNYNWADLDARAYMIDVYKYWVRDVGIDGYRFDVYWGPHIRTNSPVGGEGEMGQPVRQALKHIRPDLNLLGELSGTGVGTEITYADYTGASGPGGLDEGYDWNLKNYVQSNIWALSAATRVTNLDVVLRNVSSTSGMGFVPGPNSSFLRFLEDQDEDRIAYVYGTGVTKAVAISRTMPVSTAVNLAVGMPLVYAGQEVGRGYGISDFDARRRGVINFSDSAGVTLMPHYQKLAQIKKQFPAFWTQKMVHVGTNFPGVYAFTRPFAGQNGLVIANLEAVPHTVTVTLTSTGSPAAVEGVSDGTPLVASDLYNNDTTQTLTFTGGTAALTVTIPSLGSAVYVIDKVSHTLKLPSLTGVQDRGGSLLPGKLALAQNYPNPFNPATTISFDLPVAGKVSLKIYDILGREVATLIDGHSSAGSFRAVWDAHTGAGVPVGSGVYFYRLTAPGADGGERVLVKKMIVLK